MLKSLIFITIFSTFSVLAEEHDASFIQIREFSTGPFCTYKHHESGRIFVGKLPEDGCPQSTKIREELLGKVPTPTFALFSEVDFLPIDPAETDQYFQSRTYIKDYRFGSVDTAEYEALVSQLNRCGAFQIDIMGIPFVMTHDTNHGSYISGKAAVKGDPTLRTYTFTCTRTERRGPSCTVMCENSCDNETDIYAIEPIGNTAFSTMYRGVMPRRRQQ